MEYGGGYHVMGWEEDACGGRAAFILQHLLACRRRKDTVALRVAQTTVT